METYLKILVVLAVIGLSVGPLSYFFGTSSSNQIPYNGTDNESLVTTVSGNATGTIMEIRPYISYVGVSSSNNESFARSVMDYVNYTENYTLRVSLNPAGAGYRYEIFVPLKNSTDATEVGFRIKLNMDPFFATSYTTTLGTVQLTEPFEAGGKTIQPGNKTAASVLLYSAKKGNTVTVACQQLIITEAGALVNNPSLCVDTSKGFKYGLPIEEYLFTQDYVNKTLALNVSLIDHAEIEGTFNGTLNETQLRDELGQEMSVSNPDNGNGTGSIDVYVLDAENATLITSVQNALKEKGVNVTRTSKIGIVTDVPKEVEINGVMKRLYHIPYTTVRVGMSEPVGVRNLEVKFTMVFGEIADVIAY